MPTTETPARVNDPNEPAGEADFSATAPEPTPEGQEPPRGGRGGSRWVDYETHELLEVISQLEDERRWARLREGIWIAILVHVALISALTWIPKYVFRVPPVIDPFDAINKRKDLSYLDLPPDLLRKYQQPKVQVTPVPQKRPQIDKKTLEAMNKPTPPPLAQPAQPKLETPIQPPPVTPTPKAESPVEAPRPTAVPARPNFAIGSQNPADQLREAMRGASQNNGANSAAQPTGRPCAPSRRRRRRRPGPLRYPGRRFQLMAASLVLRDRAHLGPVDS